MKPILKKLFSYTGSAYGTREDRKFTFKGPVSLHAGMNRIALLSVAVGLPVCVCVISMPQIFEPHLAVQNTPITKNSQ